MVSFFDFPILRWGLNSIIQAGVSTTLCVLFGAMAGYAFARLRFPGNGLIFAIFVASVMMGSTETTFFVIAVYFGSVHIRRTRHAIAAGLLADLAGILASVWVCRLLLG